MSKVQIWLRDDERDLVHRALLFVVERTQARIRHETDTELFCLKFAHDRLLGVASHFASKDAA